jgi:hypothetical protein
LYGQPIVLNSSVACPTTKTGICEAFAAQLANCTWIEAIADKTMKVGDNAVTFVVNTDGLDVLATRGIFANYPVVQIFNHFGNPVEPWFFNVSANVSNSCQNPWPLTD